MKDNRSKYNDRWFEDGLKYRFRDRRSLRHFERDIARLQDNVKRGANEADPDPSSSRRVQDPH